MFKSYRISNAGPRDGGSHWLIVDDDFKELSGSYDAIDAVIDVYERKKLNVVPNLIRAMQQSSDPIEYTIALCKKKCWTYAKYEKEVDKYLVLL